MISKPFLSGNRNLWLQGGLAHPGICAANTPLTIMWCHPPPPGGEEGYCSAQDSLGFQIRLGRLSFPSNHPAIFAHDGVSAIFCAGRKPPTFLCMHKQDTTRHPNRRTPSREVERKFRLTSGAGANGPRRGQLLGAGSRFRIFGARLRDSGTLNGRGVNLPMY